MYRAVLDTNVFVSGATIKETSPSRIMDHWRKQDFVMVVSPQLINEYEDVLQRPKVMRLTGLSFEENKLFIQAVGARSHMTNGTLTLDIIKNDPDDNIVLACAEEGKATHIVTGDKKHFTFTNYKDIKIVSPSNFLALLEA